MSAPVIVPITEIHCGKCDCRAVPILQEGINLDMTATLMYVQGWESPPEDCACGCHEAFRIFNRIPITATSP